MRTLANHHPHWANPQNDIGALPASQSVDNLTIVLARTPEQEAAFKQFTEDQQNLASPSYHHWLSPQQINQRFGPSQDQITAVTGWLQSQNLTVRWIAPSGGFLGFSGAAADLGRALHTELHAYTVNGSQRISVASDPVLPNAIATNIRAIRGLYTIEDKPLHSARTISSDAPEVTTTSGSHYLGPQDFNTIYDVPNGDSGAGQTIGIVGRSRTDFADFDNLRQKTGATFANPTEVVPTSFGGGDPGPAYTTPQPSSVDLGDQLEAELDVLRAGSVAPTAKLLLVTATDNSGGIAVDALYLTQTYPLPAQVMNISFGACELDAGADGVQYWDSIFQQASSEGISVFVASGDAGAAGCDSYFDSPPASPEAISPNYICSSSYATCVGGTEFNDTADPTQYWSQANGPDLNSAFGYIPEGAWNEPLDNTTSQAASSGGGVSQYIPTPAWQAGTGVPTARAGRYTPDLAFSSSGHDGYFACFAAAGASCVSATNGSYQFEYFFGTSAAAPSMAGVTALLDQQLGAAQGNLNPELYALAAASPSAFHDVTVATSGVTGCALTTPSMCNNSLPGHTALTGGETGYLITDGYDEVTGLGSLDVGNFLATFNSLPTIRISSSYVTFPDQTVGSTGKAQLTVQNAGSTPLDPISISIETQAGASFTETDDCNITLAAGGTCTANLSFTPSIVNLWIDTLTLTSANATNPSVTVFLQGAGTAADSPLPPQVTILPIASPVYATQTLPVIVSVSPTSGKPNPTGSIVLSSGSYTSTATPLSSGSAATAAITIPANTLPIGRDTLTATYTPDAASAALYSTVSNTATVTVLAGPSFTLAGTNLSVAPGATTGNTSTITVSPTNGFTGSVVLTAAVTSAPATSQNPPSVSLGTTGTVNITGTTAGTATVTVSTTPATTSSCTDASSQRQQAFRSGLAGPFSGAVLAFALFFGIPARRRAWRSLLAIFLLLAAFTSAITACGGSGSSSCGATVIHPGTTSGNYTITVTGAAGSLSTTTTFTVTVQ